MSSDPAAPRRSDRAVPAAAPKPPVKAAPGPQARAQAANKPAARSTAPTRPAANTATRSAAPTRPAANTAARSVAPTRPAANTATRSAAPARPAANTTTRSAAPTRPAAKPAAHSAAPAKPAPARPSAKASAKPAPAPVRPPRADKKDAPITKREAKRAVTVSVMVAGVLLMGVILFALIRPHILMSRAERYAREGNVPEAEAIMTMLEKDGYPADPITAARHRLLQALVSQRRYDEALRYARDLEGEDVDALCLEARYGRTGLWYEAGMYDEAAQAFYQLGDYRDSPSMYRDCLAAAAVETYLAGDEEKARHMLLNIDDIDQRIEKAVRKVCADPAEAERLLAMDLFSPQALAAALSDIQHMSEARATGSYAPVAAGFRHTVGVTSAGAVLAAGDNSLGQCEVSGWTDVVSVAAGAYHTVGLRLDGTVLATGDNSEGQCDVSAWTEITQIAATAYGTLGLRADGTVLMAGLGADAVAGWHGATCVAGGSYACGCLYGPGTMLSSHPTAQMPVGTALTGLSLCGPVSAALDQAGALICSLDGAPAWTGLSSVVVTQTGLIGVTEDGRALTYDFRTREEKTLSVDGQVIAAAGSGTHIVVTTSDGRVFAFGEGESGQTNVSTWWLS